MIKWKYFISENEPKQYQIISRTNEDITESDILIYKGEDHYEQIDTPSLYVDQSGNTCKNYVKCIDILTNKVIFADLNTIFYNSEEECMNHTEIYLRKVEEYLRDLEGKGINVGDQLPSVTLVKRLITLKNLLKD